MTVNRATKGRHLSDTDIAALMLMIDPDLTHIEISTKFSDAPVVLVTKEGAAFEGVVTAILDHGRTPANRWQTDSRAQVCDRGAPSPVKHYSKVRLRGY